MRSESAIEYTEICSLVKDASATVTRYSSVVIALSGGALFAVFRNVDDSHYLFSAMAALFFAIITMTLQLIINYRCDSHNRLAAYRNLIASEQFVNEPVLQDDVKEQHPAVSFDVCMDHLNHVYGSAEFRFDFVKDPIQFARKGVFEGLGEDDDNVDRIVAMAFPRFVRFPNRPQYETETFVRQDDLVSRGPIVAIRRYFAIIFFRQKSDSTWSFPPYINLAITLIVLLSLLASLASLGLAYDNWPLGNTFTIAYALAYIGMDIIFCWLFYSNAVKLQNIMIGCSTIYCYFKQFIPFRLIYINQKYGYNVKPYFLGIPWKDRMPSNLGEQSALVS